MLTPSDVKTELNKIRIACTTKGKDGKMADPGPLMSQLWSRIIDDISKYGDQRCRAIIRLMQANKL